MTNLVFWGPWRKRVFLSLLLVRYLNNRPCGNVRVARLWLAQQKSADTAIQIATSVDISWRKKQILKSWISSPGNSPYHPNTFISLFSFLTRFFLREKCTQTREPLHSYLSCQCCGENLPTEPIFWTCNIFGRGYEEKNWFLEPSRNQIRNRVGHVPKDVNF